MRASGLVTLCNELGPHPLGVDGLEWYAEAALTAGLEGPTVDVLVVDGPPAFRPASALARYPALPALLPSLAADAVVILDDIVRTGEAAILDRWEAEMGLVFERRPLEAIAVGRRPAG